MRRQAEAGSRRSDSVWAMVGVAICLMAGTAQEASAYTDPGTGALLWQSILAAIAGIGYYWRKVLWSKKQKPEEPEKPAEQ